MYRVLIVEDEALERQVLRYLLAKSSLPVVVAGEAANGKEAAALADKLKPEIVLMDVKMPAMDGLQVTKAIKEKDPDIEVIIVTAYGKFSYSQQAIKYHVADYLLKPVQPDELFGALKKVITRLEKKKPAHTGSFENIPVKPGLIREMASRLLFNRPDQSKALFHQVVNELLAANPGPNSGLLASFAFETLVITVMELTSAGIQEKDITDKRRELAGEIKSINSAKDLICWADNMIDGFSLILKQRQEYDSQAIIKRVKYFIHDNYQKEITLSLAASEVHLSPAYLSRLFKQQTKTSFIEYLTKYRLQEAKKLLLNTDLTVDDIACRVGYNNNSYFTSVFKRYEDLTPSEFRARERT
ncbi:MAG: response regulator [Peptococcaceae bacterium]|nr:response regulator [Peptococcaceae bacterium]